MPRLPAPQPTHMDTPNPPCALLGSPTPAPFKGHLGRAVGSGDCTGWIALRTGSADDIPGAFDQARLLHEALSDLHATDALHLARAAWDRLLIVPRSALGTDQGADLVALVVTRDRTTTTLSGVGLSHVWGCSEKGLVMAATPNHPELAAPGLPLVPPRALVLEAPAPLYLGLPSGETQQPGSTDEALRCAGLLRCAGFTP